LWLVSACPHPSASIRPCASCLALQGSHPSTC
jgi:hypothetical protein